MGELREQIKEVLRDIVLFSQRCYGLTLREYQAQTAREIVDSILRRDGRTFVVQFPRQSGKNELQAQIETYILILLSQEDAEIVKVSPTWKPQSINAMRRLERVLERHLITKVVKWKKENGYIYRVGDARIFFLSGAPTASVVGATASTLLECDEAQDVVTSKWDKDFNPMAASTNATRVFWGTAWSGKTLLARELRAAREAERVDGKRRVFVIDAEAVGKEVPAYKEFVKGEVKKLGREHPMIKTQYFGEEIDSEGGMFPERRLALMRGTHPRRHAPEPGKVYAILIDLAGEDESLQNPEDGDKELANPKRDSTALTVVEVDLSTVADELVRAPTYRVVERKEWVGTRHTELYGRLRAVIDLWRARRIVVDATGVGAGLASFLAKAYGEAVTGFIFNQSTKSKLGWDFLATIETGRFKDWQAKPGEGDERSEFERQARQVEMEVLPGPERRMRWSVPEGRRDPETGEVMHDDWVLSAALIAVLDGLEWVVGGPALITQGRDPLSEMDREGF